MAVDPNLISLGLLGLSVVQTVALAYIAAKYGTVQAKAADARADRVREDVQTDKKRAAEKPLVPGPKPK